MRIIAKNLVKIYGDRSVVNDVSFDVNKGEVVGLLGPNGAGKTTTFYMVVGLVRANKGQVLIEEDNGNTIDITELPMNERAKLGIFLGMQMPLTIEGVTNADFLRSALRAKEGDNFKLLPFIRKVDKLTEKLHMDSEMIHRGINDGFSGGERKKNEILQMCILKPNVVLLDEIDSGLDVDSLKLVGESVMDYYNECKPAILLVTHYQRLLDYIKPDFIHIMKDGKIVLSGDKKLALKIEEEGYDKLVGKNHE